MLNGALHLMFTSCVLPGLAPALCLRHNANSPATHPGNASSVTHSHTLPTLRQLLIHSPCQRFVSHSFTHPASASSVTHSLTLPTNTHSPCMCLITHPANTWSSHPATNQSLTALLLLSAASLGFFALGCSGPAAASWLRPRLQRGVGQGGEVSRGHLSTVVEFPLSKCNTHKTLTHTKER